MKKLYIQDEYIRSLSTAQNLNEVSSWKYVDTLKAERSKKIWRVSRLFQCILYGEKKSEIVEYCKKYE